MLVPELYPDEIAEPDPLHFARQDCEQCGAPVLVLTVNGKTVLVDVAEVQPEAECPNCEQVRGRGHRRSSCPRCGMRGRIGEPLPLRGVAVAEDGRARVWTRRRACLRREGDAIHPYHACIEL